jgi:hypothetical protein
LSVLRSGNIQFQLKKKSEMTLSVQKSNISQYRALLKQESGRLDFALEDFSKFPMWLFLYFGEPNVEKSENFLRFPSFFMLLNKIEHVKFSEFFGVIHRTSQ